MIHNRMPEQCYRALLPSTALSNAVSTSTDVTDGRTNEEGCSVRDLSCVSNAREIRSDSASMAATITRFAVTR